MEEAAENLDFERAARLPRPLRGASHVQSHQGINPQSVDEADVFAIHQEGGQTCIQVFFFRTGQNWGNRAYFPKADRVARRPPRCSAAFLGQFYDDKPLPQLILCRTTSTSRSCWPRRCRPRPAARSRSAVPQRGEKRELVDHALDNAREALARQLAESRAAGAAARGRRRGFRPASRARAHRGLRQLPHHGHQRRRRHDRRRARGFSKNQYRKFNIKASRHHPRRRLRHDARGAAAALRAALAEGRPASEPASEPAAAGPTWC